MEQNNTITPKQALEIFGQVAMQYRGTRQEHETIERAFKALAAIVESQVKAD